MNNSLPIDYALLATMPHDTAISYIRASHLTHKQSERDSFYTVVYIDNGERQAQLVAAKSIHRVLPKFQLANPSTVVLYIEPTKEI
jgi:hypothetical protein